MATVATPDYIVVSGTVAAMTTFSADVDAQVALGYGPLGVPTTDGVGIWQIMFKGQVASFVSEYVITGLPGAPTAGYQTLTVAPITAGAFTTSLLADTYDFDVTIDGGALQQLSIIITGGEDYTAIAALMDAQVVGGSVAYSDALSAFVVTSATTGPTSSVLVAAGTAGSTGGDLFAALETADTVTITFDAPVDGTDSTDAFEIAGNQTQNFNAGYKFTVTRSTGNDGVYTVADGGSSYAAGFTTIPINETLPSPVVDGFIEGWNPSVGP